MCNNNRKLIFDLSDTPMDRQPTAKMYNAVEFVRKELGITCKSRTYEGMSEFLDDHLEKAKAHYINNKADGDFFDDENPLDMCDDDYDIGWMSYSDYDGM